LIENSLARPARAAVTFRAVMFTAKVVGLAAMQPTRIGVKSPMNLHARLDALKERHSSLEARLFDEDHRPLPDTETLFRLKAEKLQIKDEMERIRSSLH